MKNKLLGMATIATAMTLTSVSALSGVQNVVEEANKAQVKEAFAQRAASESQAESQPASQPTKEQIQKIASTRTSDSRYFAPDYGIPPKIYGMYHVKRGTHKRTNI